MQSKLMDSVYQMWIFSCEDADHVIVAILLPDSQQQLTAVEKMVLFDLNQQAASSMLAQSPF